MDVGLELRQARERRGISIEQLSNTTKISPRVLHALEASDDSRLPALVFTRGFVKAYASAVELDPDDTLRRYLDQFQPPAPPALAEPGSTQEPAAPPHDSPRHSPARVLQGRFGTAIILSLVSLTILALLAAQRPQPRPVVPGPQAVATAGLVPAGPAQQMAAGTSGTSTASADALHIAIAPTGPCWVQATVGDSVLFAKLLNAGDRRTIDSPSEIGLRIGDPTAFAFTINGKPGQIQGGRGQAVTVRIARDNYTQFLAR